MFTDIWVVLGQIYFLPVLEQGFAEVVWLSVLHIVALCQDTELSAECGSICMGGDAAT